MKTSHFKTVIFAALLLPTVALAQQTISGTFSPASDFTYAFLYRATPTGPIYVDRSELTEEGGFEITLDSSASKGIYKIVYATPPEEFNFDLMYNGNEDVVLNFDAEKGLEFIQSKDNKLWTSYTSSIDMVNRTISNYYTKQSSDKKAFAGIFKTLESTQQAFEEASKGKISHTFITANRPYVPRSYEDLSTYSKHLKLNYLNHVDFSDQLLQSSDFLSERALTYVFGMPGSSNPEEQRKAIDHLVGKMEGINPIVKTTILVKVWQEFAETENKEMSDYLIDNYLLNLAKQTDNGALADQLNSYRNTTIGTKAPDFTLSSPVETANKGKTLYDLNEEKSYLLIFWSSGCSHCLDELPKVKNLLKSNPNIQVVAFGLEDDDKNWSREIKKYPDFIHVLGLGKWENTTAKTYGISGTPSYFMLDSNKVITAKPFDYEALKELLNQ